MKREGRQHGYVSCHYVPPPIFCRQSKLNKMVDSAAARGSFIKVSNKPTNSSKFTARCRHPYKGCKCCHITPGYKSKDKTKGTMKLRIDSGNKLTKYYSGSSVTGVLAYLANENGYNDDDGYDYEGMVEENYDYGYDHAYDDHDHREYGHVYDDGHHEHHDDDHHRVVLGVGFGIGIDVGEIDVKDDDDGDDDDDNMSFCDVGLCWGHGDGDDDGWYLVGGEME